MISHDDPGEHRAGDAIESTLLIAGGGTAAQPPGVTQALADTGKFKVRLPKSSKLYSSFADQLGRNPYSMPVPSNAPKRVSLALALADAVNAPPGAVTVSELLAE